MSRFSLLALVAALGLSACVGAGEAVVSSRNLSGPVFVPDLGGPH